MFLEKICMVGINVSRVFGCLTLCAVLIVKSVFSIRYGSFKIAFMISAKQGDYELCL